MGVGTSDGKYYDNEFEMLAEQADATPKLVADKQGRGSDMAGPYLPDHWGQLSDSERKDLVEGAMPVFSDDFPTRKHLEDLIDQHGTVELDPRGNPTVDEFLRNPPQGVERFNYMGDPNRTIMLRKGAIPTS